MAKPGSFSQEQLETLHYLVQRELALIAKRQGKGDIKNPATMRQLQHLGELTRAIEGQKI